MLTCSVFDDKAAIIGVLKGLMTSDMALATADRNPDASFPNLSVVVSILKTHGALFLPEVPAAEQAADGPGGEEAVDVVDIPPMPEVFTPDEQAQLLQCTDHRQLLSCSPIRNMSVLWPAILRNCTATREWPALARPHG